MPFKPGVSGNPRGRPRKDYDAQAMVAEATRDGAALIEFWLDAIKRETYVDDEQRIISGPTWADKREFSKLLAHRLWGKEPDSLNVQLSNPEGNAYVVEVHHVHENSDGSPSADASAAGGV